jgi:uncharacterized SAM-binding protein YcdF (DUF218 family)
VGAAFLIVAETPLANLVAAPLCRVKSQEAPADIAIVLSGGRYRDGSLNGDSVERTVAAVRLYHRGVVPRLLFTGGPCCGGSTSALMARLASELGVPGEAILVEENSDDTHQNAVNSAAMARQHGFRSALLVTGTLHLRRAEGAFAAAGLPVRPVRASEKDLTLLSGAWERIALVQAAIHEHIGLAYYRARGWV